MTAHTPGPWRVGDAGATVFGPANGNPAPETIARMAPRKQYKANARLIAAAPELLEALRSIAESYPTTEEGETLAAIARAAIAAATGEGE